MKLFMCPLDSRPDIRISWKRLIFEPMRKMIAPPGTQNAGYHQSVFNGTVRMRHS
jgi:hypothetical protein